MLINAAFHTGFWGLLFFIVGMIRPNWALFFLKKPDRILVVVITTVLFMITFTLFAEGNRQKLEAEKAAKEVVSKIIKPSSAPVPVPVPAPAPGSPITKPSLPKN